MRPTRYHVSVVRGLEAVAAAEIARRLPTAMVQAVRPGRVWLSDCGDPGDLLRLRTTEEVFASLAEIEDLPSTRAGLAEVERQMRAVDLSAALAARARLARALGEPRFRITATREGVHDYTSNELAAAAGAGVVAQTGWRVDLTHHDIDIWLQVEGAGAAVGLRLSGEGMSRRSRVSHGVASLRPTVAHAMCLLAGTRAGGVFLDPMCGSGTVLIERAGAGRDAVLLGLDLDPRPLRAAGENLRAAGVPATLCQADGRSLPLPAASVDTIVSNLPWGRRVGSHRANRRMYPQFMAEAVRVLQPGGTMVLLTIERRLMQRLVAEHPALSLDSVTVVNLGGLEPSIYVLRGSAPDRV